MTTVRIGTRGSALALAQTRQVADSLARASGLDVELVTITTHGDTTSESLSQLGGTGVFTGALREALLNDEIDVAVHSLKDLPTAEHPDLVLAAVPKRADARDVLCARDGLTLDDLAAGARIGTGSPRRIAQVRSRRPDLTVVDIRGNIDTRLGRVFDDVDDDRRLDAIVLAAAGLGRLGRADAATQHLELSDWPTAPGQGALALETRRAKDASQQGRALAKALNAVNHATTRAVVAAERGVLAGLEAGCAAPLGTTALVEDGLLFLTATVYQPDGTRRLTSSHAVSLEGNGQAALLEAAQDAARRVVDELFESGAADLAPLGGAA
ncbi:hydroxymethylbilane synthase [Humibacter sp.]|jgi:hydroxymethylbilane synthase|uniref:hydroxymethylbilane synthase n=1 Tax=Humibacter sp. TaxID=1940291 RepID=UPI002C85D663|nr:hydroxymethylbilane synthase [Humibacter sp.]HVX06845.1 hydroxymethylbilane synthase [Humibacter sp.]